MISSDVIEESYFNFDEFFTEQIGQKTQGVLKFDRDPWMYYTRKVCNFAFAILTEACNKIRNKF